MKLKIINNISIAFVAVLFFASCGNSQKELLCKKWKTVKLKNSKMDQEMAFMQQYIDTIGQNDPELRSSVNLDSTKMLLKMEMERSLTEQKQALENTLMEFKNNGVAYTTSIDGIDSAMFDIEDGDIKIDESKLKGVGETMTFHIISLTKDSLKMRIVDYGDTSIVEMIPAN